ncbi:MAG: metallophosphoesterase family protein [Solirubrobacterales bacterium]
MKIAILSDIHGNLPALETVLEDTADTDVDELWCLGDTVGYGAFPNECAALVQERCSAALLGNHDLAALGRLDTSTFSAAASAAVEWSEAALDERTRAYLGTLSPSDASRPAALYHASPRDPVWEYVLWPEQAAECLMAQERRVSMVGHSHVALFFSIPEPTDPRAAPEREARGWQAGAGTKLEISEGRWLINPGSVGQPRDGDPRAAWLELDTETWEATYHRIAYDIERAATAIFAAGLPENLGKRLHVGR